MHISGSRPPAAGPTAPESRRTATSIVRVASSRGRTQTECGRRDLALVALAAALAPSLARPERADAAGFKKELKKRKVSVEEYELHEPSGLRVYDLAEGRGREIKEGDKVTVHFDCTYRGIDAVSSRYARTLGGNRTIAEPLEFVVGEFVTGSAMKPAGDSAGGLFAGSSGPKPPQAISRAVVGMRAGGKRLVLVDVPGLGYPKGNQEIPPGEPFELRVEVLSIA